MSEDLSVVEADGAPQTPAVEETEEVEEVFTEGCSNVVMQYEQSTLEMYGFYEIDEKIGEAKIEAMIREEEIEEERSSFFAQILTHVLLPMGIIWAAVVFDYIPLTQVERWALIALQGLNLVILLYEESGGIRAVELFRTAVSPLLSRFWPYESFAPVSVTVLLWMSILCVVSCFVQDVIKVLACVSLSRAHMLFHKAEVQGDWSASVDASTLPEILARMNVLEPELKSLQAAAVQARSGKGTLLRRSKLLSDLWGPFAILWLAISVQAIHLTWTDRGVLVVLQVLNCAVALYDESQGIQVVEVLASVVSTVLSFVWPLSSVAPVSAGVFGWSCIYCAVWFVVPDTIRILAYISLGRAHVMFGRAKVDPQLAERAQHLSLPRILARTSTIEGEVKLLKKAAQKRLESETKETKAKESEARESEAQGCEEGPLPLE
mmetsp:Transcript_11259/g.31236  ORF Transcript_11259/g.31236 Transcript_11259/m.31236 type:complete len:435 (-) Transcript_11259:36-1340(-)